MSVLRAGPVHGAIRSASLPVPVLFRVDAPGDHLAFTFSPQAQRHQLHKGGGTSLEIPVPDWLWSSTRGCCHISRDCA